MSFKEKSYRALNLMVDFFKRYQILVLISVAFIFSITIHLMWQFVFGDNPLYYWNGTLMINTNDGYYFASGVQKELFGMHEPNPLIPTIYERGLVFVTYWLAKILPFSLDTIILYMPAVVSSLIVVPMVLIGKLYDRPVWGFFSALVGSIAWSYYNRTLVGYYDTDMFALTIPVFILYFLLKSVRSFDLRDILFASLIISLYEFLYLPGKTVAYALGFIYILYLVYLHFFEKRDKELLLKFAILLFVSLSKFYLPIFSETIFKIALLVGLYYFLSKREFSAKSLMVASIALSLYFLISSEALLNIYHRIIGYTTTGTTEEGLHFFKVMQTVSEATGIPMFSDGTGRENVAYRIMGSTAGFLIFILGYILLVIRNKEFILALPLVAIGLFAHWGGLRFTVYAVPIAGLSSVYLFCWVGKYLFSGDKGMLYRYGFVSLGVFALIYPNIQHTFRYNPGTVFNKNEVKDLVKLNAISKPQDYTLTWWDYGYPIWYYSDTITLIDGSKHHEDNFVISKIFLSTSQRFASNFSKLAVEKFAQSADSLKEYRANGEREEDIPDEFKLIENKEVKHSGTGAIIKALLRVKQQDQKDPTLFLQSLESKEFKPPLKKRDIYLYAPLKMHSIFLTVSQFGNIDLSTGKRLRNIWFYPTFASTVKDSVIKFKNGVNFDYRVGKLFFSKNNIDVEYFITTYIDDKGNIAIKPRRYFNGGDKVVLFIKNIKRFIIMDKETFKSNYVQMFLLGNYDKELFELVIKSPYGRVYRVK